MDGEAKFSITPPTIPNRSIYSQMGLNDQQQTQAWQIANSFRSQQVATILDGNSDPQYSYIITANNIGFSSGQDCGSWTVQFLHRLSFAPVVNGSLHFSGEAVDRPLPFLAVNPGSPTAFPELMYTVTINRVDEIYIYVDFSVLNNDGATLISANIGTPYIFKFVCQREPSV